MSRYKLNLEMFDECDAPRTTFFDSFSSQNSYLFCHGIRLRTLLNQQIIGIFKQTQNRDLRKNRIKRKT